MTDDLSIWQLSGGPTSRLYADVFLRHGVALIGPGDAGPWRADRADDAFDGGFVRRFAEEVQVGDAVLLRTGLSKIKAVGLVASEYLYLPAFDDVNGWDLQHARRVRWAELPAEYDFGAAVFSGSPPPVSLVRDETVVEYVRRFLNSPPTRWQDAPLPALLEEEPPLDDVPRALQGVVGTARDLHALFWDPERFGDHPTEDERVAHLVIPFLRALGWPPERIAIKWRRIDVALFSSLPRTPQSCRLVIEAKRVGEGVESALDQAKGYVRALGVPRDIVVTDGIRYRFYSCERDFAPVAYAHLVRLKRGAAELFERMKRP